MEEKRLLPVADIPDITNAGSTYDTEYKPSLKWDIEAGDFVRTASNAVPRSTGYEGFQIWCRKTVATERFSCLAYSRDTGIVRGRFRVHLGNGTCACIVCGERKRRQPVYCKCNDSQIGGEGSGKTRICPA